MRGFSLIEVVVVVAIALLLSGLALASFRQFGHRLDVGATAQKIVVTLDDARNRTLGSRADSRWGVHFAADSYTLFPGSTYTAGSSSNEVHALPAGLTIDAINLAGGGSDVVFDSLTGNTSLTGTVRLALTETPANNQTITITAAGQADVGGSVNPTDTRVTDTRHVHFTLGWTIQNTSTLTLTFSNPGHVETVTISDHMNSDQTDFDYTGTIAVDGNEEILRIQSHSIDATNTTLSIERDRRDNQIAVAVAIDGNNIVSYAADGTATLGPDGGTMQIQ